MAKQELFTIEIDKLTRSVENAITGDSFKTQMVELTPKDIKSSKEIGSIYQTVPLGVAIIKDNDKLSLPFQFGCHLLKDVG